MKRVLLSLLTLLLLMGVVGCTKHVVRDAAVYTTEMNQYDSWAKKQAGLLKEFLGEHCTCDAAKKFTTKRCSSSADYILTIEARADWHRAMSDFNAGLSEKRPPKDPPAIPANSTLCPGGE